MSKFIRATRQNDGAYVWINLDTIDSVATDIAKTGGSIIAANGFFISTKEAPEFFLSYLPVLKDPT